MSIGHMCSKKFHKIPKKSPMWNSLFGLFSWEFSKFLKNNCFLENMWMSASILKSYYQDLEHEFIEVDA